ncbi:MAG: deoxyuridine 5'-triphosphate nucleotidohydrolase [Caldisphaera sp.]|nr:MAG: deoxyuridine 5'-triphosphate nucleotidohydrolase [Caldisphaera sp.]
MAYTGKEISKFIKGIEEEQIQPAGIDLKLDKVFKFLNSGFLGKNERILPDFEEVTPINNIYLLNKGGYKIRFYDAVEIPKDAIGVCFPRSSLLRMGASIICALWDPGYVGRGEALLNVINDNGIKIERYARIAQITFIKLKNEPDKTYNGIYNNENL